MTDEQILKTYGRYQSPYGCEVQQELEEEFGENIIVSIPLRV